LGKQKESEAALYPNREFGFRKILEACPGVFRQISEVPDGHPPAHQGATFERADPEKDLSADIIYVGGGNTLQMMRVWRRFGVDKLIKSAYESGTVLSGISAGSICWFDSGHSDSMSFYNPRKWKYTNVRGLGLIRGGGCKTNTPEETARARRVAGLSTAQRLTTNTRGMGELFE
jgi:putative intracellular protease/amidase